MASGSRAAEIMDREFLEVRAKIVELAASFDRLERAEGSIDGDPRLSLISEALRVVQADEPDRAEQVQLIFSRQYDDDWRDRFRLDTVKNDSTE